MSALTPPQLYRSVLRQFVQNSIYPRAERSSTISAHLRAMFEAARTIKPDSPEAAALARNANNMVVYLKSHRLHKALVERYNPTNVLSGEERATMSAKMVGLSMPKQFDPLAPVEEGEDGKPKGSIQSMFS